MRPKKGRARVSSSGATVSANARSEADTSGLRYAKTCEGSSVREPILHRNGGACVG